MEYISPKKKLELQDNEELEYISPKVKLELQDNGEMEYISPKAKVGNQLQQRLEITPATPPKLISQYNMIDKLTPGYPKPETGIISSIKGWVTGQPQEVGKVDKAINLLGGMNRVIAAHFAYYANRKIGRASCREECRSRWSPYH